MEEFTLSALTIAGLFWFVSQLLSKISINKQSVSVHKNRHGHRCYIEGLNDAERRLVECLATGLSHQDYYIFNNIILPSNELITTQIDHVVVSRYGIFVIENKDYSGWIYAHQNRKEWTQTFRTGQKFTLQNPLWQNFAHISALKEQLKFVGNRLHSLVVFTGDAEFKTGRPKNVLFLNELVPYITSVQDVVFKEVELLVVIGKLSMLCQSVDVTNGEHIENVTKRIAANQYPLSRTQDS